MNKTPFAEGRTPPRFLKGGKIVRKKRGIKLGYAFKRMATASPRVGKPPGSRAEVGVVKTGQRGKGGENSQN